MNYLFGWHSNFIIIGASSIILLIFQLNFFPETLPHNKRSLLSFYNIFITTKNILFFKPFISYAILFPLFCLGEWSCLIIMPFFLENNLGFQSKQSGYIIGVMASTYIFSAALAPMVINKYGLNATIKCGIYLTFIGGIFLFYAFLTSTINIYFIFSSIIFYFFGGAFIFGASSSIALQSINVGRGIASTIRTSLFLLFSTMGSLFGCLFSNNYYLLTTSLCMVFSTISIFIIYKYFCISSFKENVKYKVVMERKINMQI